VAIAQTAPGGLEKRHGDDADAVRADDTVAADPAATGHGGGGRTALVALLVVLLVISVAGLVYTLSVQLRESALQSRQIELSSRLLMLSQRLPKLAREASLGESSAYRGLEDSRAAIASIVDSLASGDAAAGIAAVAERARPLLESVATVWGPINESTSTILANEAALLDVRRHVAAINELTPVLLAQSDEVVEALIQDDAAVELVNVGGRQRTLTQRIRASVNEFAAGQPGGEVAANQFGRDLRLFGSTATLLRSNASEAVRARLEAVDGTHARVAEAVSAILGQVSEFLSTQKAARDTGAAGDKLLTASQRLVAGISAPRHEAWFGWLPWGFGFAAALLLLVLVSLFIGQARRQAFLSSSENRRTQDSVLKLLDEISALADGDLRIQAEVTDRLTGAIADAVNYAVEEMRELVRRIQRASRQVADETSATSRVAGELSQASERQLAEIGRATDRIEAMAEAMRRMSAEADDSIAAARNSRDVAQRGASSVRQTIQGLNDMRQQIQETAKRIKRLGESSQQINDIVSLITDVAEQTNVLSLNASIQAAMAGQAGRGFAVVADEVQRLADRSGQASRQITDLVKVIQSDTSSAVESMEQATREVVEGTNLADAAGRALVEIDEVSKQLSDLITTMAASARQNAESAVGISQLMGTIRASTSDTVSGVRGAAESIGALALVARELEESVSGFRLPDE
jgi:twitching motility protein PilJ